MLRFIQIICFSILGLGLNAQNLASISGRILDESTGDPIPFTLIYIDGTTVGETTDEQGGFRFDSLTIPSKLIISHVSYYPQVLTVSQKTDQISISLKAKEIVLEEVIVQKKGLREKYVKDFRKWFLGTDQYGVKSKILNEDVLVFYNDGDRLNITATEPLKVMSKLLGYDVHVDLVSCEISYDSDFKANSSAYVASYFFQAQQGKKFDRNRKRAYFNSSEHFLKALYDNDLARNGFQALEEARDSTGRKILREIDLSAFMAQQSLSEKEVSGLSGKLIYLKYFYGRNNQPVNLTVDPTPGFYNLSAVEFLENSTIIRFDGTTASDDVVFSGAIAKKKIGALLPQDLLIQSSFQQSEGSEPKQIPDRLIRTRN